MSDVFDKFVWHSSIGIDDTIAGKKFTTRLANTEKTRRMFVASGDSLLIHRATKCLWKISDDEKSIEPVFSTDILTEDDVREIDDES